MPNANSNAKSFEGEEYCITRTFVPFYTIRSLQVLHIKPLKCEFMSVCSWCIIGTLDCEVYKSRHLCWPSESKMILRAQFVYLVSCILVTASVKLLFIVLDAILINNAFFFILLIVFDMAPK